MLLGFLRLWISRNSPPLFGSAVPYLAGSILLAACGFSTGGVMAQGYPTRPVRIVVPFSPGGSTDAIARTFAQKFADAWGHQVLVENRAGAGAIIGSEVVAKAAPDGHTLLMTTTGHALLSSLYRKLPFDPVNDFAAVTQVTSTYLVLVSNPSVQASSVRELVALARANPGKMNYGHTGVGVAPHLVAEMLRIAAGINVVAVPYKGGAPLALAILANEVQYAFVPATDVVENVKAGRLRVLGVSGTSRGVAFPDAPSMIEAGLPSVEYAGWVGLFAPAGTARDILLKVSAEVARVLRLQDVAARLPGWGGEAAGTMPEQFSAKLREDVTKYAKIIKEARIPMLD